MVLEPGIQWRRDRLPSITVRGVVPDDVQSPDVANAVFAKLKPLRDALPAGYRIELQGAVEESVKSQASINAKMPVMLLVILLLLMIQLQHFGKTMLVLATGPLGLIGAAAALLVFQAPFGFVAILGVIALAGIIMRNSVILVDQIEQDLAAGHDGLDVDRRVGRAPLPAHRADGGSGGAGPDPARRRGVLGADGAGHDGRPDRGNHADFDVPAGALRSGVQDRRVWTQAGRGGEPGARGECSAGGCLIQRVRQAVNGADTQCRRRSERSEPSQPRPLLPSAEYKAATPQRKDDTGYASLCATQEHRPRCK